MRPLNRKLAAREEYYEMRVISTGGFFFEVMKLESGKRYAVDLSKMTCTCPDHKERQVKCKHIWRVELEGYEGPRSDSDSLSTPESPESKTDWRPEGEDFMWFDIRHAGAGIECLFCEGAKKDWKFWIGIPGRGSTSGIFTLYWGAFDEAELQRKTARGVIVSCQRREKGSRTPFHDVSDRAEKKKAKGYRHNERLRKMLLRNLRLDSDPDPAGDTEPQPEPREGKEETKTNWKPGEDFVWFNNLSVSAQDLSETCLCLVAQGKKKLSRYWIAFWDNQCGRVCLFWGEYDSLSELFTSPLRGQCEELQGLSHPYKEARDRFLKILKKTKEGENYDSPHGEERQALLRALAARYAVGDTLVIQKPKKTKTNWKPDENFFWF